MDIQKGFFNIAAELIEQRRETVQDVAAKIRPWILDTVAPKFRNGETAIMVTPPDIQCERCVMVDAIKLYGFEVNFNGFQIVVELPEAAK